MHRHIVVASHFPVEYRKGAGRLNKAFALKMGEIHVFGKTIAAADIELRPEENYYECFLEDRTGEKTIASMDAAGIDKAVLLPLDFGTRYCSEPATSIEQQNLEFSKLQEKYPDRFIAFCGVDPLRGMHAQNIFRRAVAEWGMKGLKLHPTAGFRLNDTRYCYPLYAMAEKLDLPVLVHAGFEPCPPVRHTAKSEVVVDPIYIDDVCVDFPNMRVVCAHLGTWPFVSSWNEVAMNLTRWHDNLYLDTAYTFMQLLAKQEREKIRWYQVLREALDIAPRRVMFGTDDPFTSQYFSEGGKSLVKVLTDKSLLTKARVEFTQEELYDLFEGNAKRFLKLKE